MNECMVDCMQWIEHHISVGVGRFYIYDNGERTAR